MIQIDGLIFYVGPPISGPIPTPKKLVGRNDGSLPRVFREALLKSQAEFTVNLEVVNYPVLHCHFARCGQAAGLARWYRGERTEAVTAYLPGVDQRDERALERALASKPYPISLHDWYRVLDAKRPIYANFLMTPIAPQDGLLAQAADALAFSFFSVLGQT